MQVSTRVQRLLGQFQQTSLCQYQLQLRAFAAASGQLEAIKTLRESTSAPITDVKKALVEASWNVGMPPDLICRNMSCFGTGKVYDVRHIILQLYILCYCSLKAGFSYLICMQKRHTKP